MSSRKRYLVMVALLMTAVVCHASQVEPVALKIALDWTPNTNHTGLVVAQQLGYFSEEGLDVDIVQPGPTMSIQLVATGKCAFAVSMQEYVTMSRAQGVPVVSIAAIFPHNTSGFAIQADLEVQSAADFENLRYGGWGSDLEAVMLQTAMQLEGAVFETVEMFNLGMLDFATAVERDFADIFWIFYGWQGIHANLRGIEFTYLPLTALADALDYYTPVIVASEETIAQRPELVTAFTRAIARGYVYAAENPEEAARLLLAFAPELDSELVFASQRWLAGQSETDLDSWGIQEAETWARFAEWAYENGLIETEIDPDAAYTNDFLPSQLGADE